MDLIVYTVGVITLVALALIGAKLVFAWALRTERDLKHRRAVREALDEGWAEPRLPRNWHPLGDALPGLAGVQLDPDPGVGVSEWAAYTRGVARRVEEAWLTSIEEERRRTVRRDGEQG